MRSKRFHIANAMVSIFCEFLTIFQIGIFKPVLRSDFTYIVILLDRDILLSSNLLTKKGDSYKLFISIANKLKIN